jgi:hypothetical protein
MLISDHWIWEKLDARFEVFTAVKIEVDVRAWKASSGKRQG